MAVGPRRQVRHTSLHAWRARTPDARAAPRALGDATRSDRRRPTRKPFPGSHLPARDAGRSAPRHSGRPGPGDRRDRAPLTRLHTPPPRASRLHSAMPQRGPPWTRSRPPRGPARPRRARSREDTHAPRLGGPRRAPPRASSVAHPGPPRSARRLAGKGKARAAQGPHSPPSRAGSERASFRRGAQRRPRPPLLRKLWRRRRGEAERRGGVTVVRFTFPKLGDPRN
ncbi:proline-rich protein HaeIII subfamily 1-like [Meriones unguiculatus]|uniref:proline-rich protein HaeIII subfamily 1-like n=1 Tax=Meriones unguiculatus TaxID=10047 RepID=UPI00293F281D|nr:proline-rich protein HaeIII subfamily 1-like [Meriones unguiculatus]